MSRVPLFALVLLAALLNDIAQALRNVRAVVPQAVPVGDSATLRCLFDLEGEPLYTVKWYRGKSEFYRYVPKEMPSMRVFSLPGLKVDMSQSTVNEVVLADVQPDVSGRYKCEVSTDAPNFYTQIVSGYMHVVEVPEEEPIVTAEKELLDYGYAIRGNCTTPATYPPMNVTWYLNGQKVNENHMKRKISMEDMESAKNLTIRKAKPTISFLELEIDRQKFVAEILEVECSASLFDVYARMSRLILGATDRPKPSSIQLGASAVADAPSGKSLEEAKCLILSTVLLAGILR